MKKIALRYEIARAIAAGYSEARDIARQCRGGSFADVCALLHDEVGGWWTWTLRGHPEWAVYRLTAVGLSAVA